MEQLQYVRDYKPTVYGGPTSMVSLIIPPGANLGDIRQRMKRERQTASNIKSRVNRKSVQSALGGIIEYLKTLRIIPSKGVALFSDQWV